MSSTLATPALRSSWRARRTPSQDSSMISVRTRPRSLISRTSSTSSARSGAGLTVLSSTRARYQAKSHQGSTLQTSGSAQSASGTWMTPMGGGTSTPSLHAHGVAPGSHQSRRSRTTGRGLTCTTFQCAGTVKGTTSTTSTGGLMPRV